MIRGASKRIDPHFRPGHVVFHRPDRFSVHAPEAVEAVEIIILAIIFAGAVCLACNRDLRTQKGNDP